MRMRLVARDILVDQMARKGWTNRSLAEYVGCAPGTIDNLVAGRTRSVNGPKKARLISEALGLPVEIFFVPVLSSTTRQVSNRSFPPRVRPEKGGGEGDD